MKLAELIKQDTFSSPAQEAILNVIVSSSWLLGRLGEQLAPYDITLAQYNVLRILRGSHPEKMTCGHIGERLLDRTPDVTRLLGRLQRAGLIHRARAEQDRRVVEVGITEQGLALLEKLQPNIEQFQEALNARLSDEECQQLNHLLERVRTVLTPADEEAPL